MDQSMKPPHYITYIAYRKGLDLDRPARSIYLSMFLPARQPHCKLPILHIIHLCMYWWITSTKIHEQKQTTIIICMLAQTIFIHITQLEISQLADRWASHTSPGFISREIHGNKYAEIYTSYITTPSQSRKWNINKSWEFKTTYFISSIPTSQQVTHQQDTKPFYHQAFQYQQASSVSTSAGTTNQQRKAQIARPAHIATLSSPFHIVVEP